MREFIIRARGAPADAQRFREQGRQAHVEILAHCLMNALFLAKGHREDSQIHLVLESSADYARTLTYDGLQIRDLGGFSEQALLESISVSLESAVGLILGESTVTDQGVTVKLQGFDRLVKDVAESGRQLLLLARKGGDLRQADIGDAPCFVLTDHIPMPGKTVKYLRRLGAQRISLGPRELFASQCVSLIHNELDRRGV